MISNNSPEWPREMAVINDEGNREFEGRQLENPAAPCRQHRIILNDEQSRYMRSLVAAELADRHCELRKLMDTDRFHNMRNDCNESIRIGTELIDKLPVIPRTA